MKFLPNQRYAWGLFVSWWGHLQTCVHQMWSSKLIWRPSDHILAPNKWHFHSMLDSNLDNSAYHHSLNSSEDSNPLDMSFLPSQVTWRFFQELKDMCLVCTSLCVLHKAMASILTASGSDSQWFYSCLFDLCNSIWTSNEFITTLKYVLLQKCMSSF